MASAGGNVVESGDAEAPFTIMSVAKPFVFALVCEAVGVEEVRRRVGVNATGMAFNSAHAVERDPGGRTNPMVNPGAIATTGLAPGGDLEERWARLHDGLSRVRRPRAGDGRRHARPRARSTNHRNRGLANMLAGLGALDGRPGRRRRALHPAELPGGHAPLDIAVMGATLADGGTNPITRERVVDPRPRTRPWP